MRTNVTQCVTSSDEGQRLCKHFIILFDANQLQCHVKCIGTAHTNYSLLSVCIFSHIFFKAINKLTYRRNEGGINTLIEIFLFIAHKNGNSQWGKLLVTIY